MAFIGFHYQKDSRIWRHPITKNTVFDQGGVGWEEWKGSSGRCRRQKRWSPKKPRKVKKELVYVHKNTSVHFLWLRLNDFEAGNINYFGYHKGRDMKSWLSWAQMALPALVAISGSKNSRFQGPPLILALVKDIACLNSITYSGIKTTGTLIVKMCNPPHSQGRQGLTLPPPKKKILCVCHLCSIQAAGMPTQN